MRDPGAWGPDYNENPVDEVPRRLGTPTTMRNRSMRDPGAWGPDYNEKPPWDEGPRRLGTQPTTMRHGAFAKPLAGLPAGRGVKPPTYI